MSDAPEFQRFVTNYTRRGPELEELADSLFAELPEQCRDCPMAFAARCAIAEDDFWLPRTPRPIREIKFGDSTGYSIVSGTAESALRSIVKMANEQVSYGPSGIDGSVCCLDPRDVDAADYER